MNLIIFVDILDIQHLQLRNLFLIYPESTKKQILSQISVQYIDNGATKYLYSFEEAAMREQIKVLNIKNGVRVEYSIGREESRKLVPRWIEQSSFDRYIKAPLEAAVANGDFDAFYFDKFMANYKPEALSNKKSICNWWREHLQTDASTLYTCSCDENQSRL